jgi:hypothetical protein
MSTLVMVKTVCCESYKECGKRCSLCPHRPENRANVARYQSGLAAGGLGRRLRNISDAARFSASGIVADPDLAQTTDIDVASGC